MKRFLGLAIALLLTTPCLSHATEQTTQQCRQLEQEFRASPETTPEKLQWFMENCDIEVLLAIDREHSENSDNKPGRHRHP